MINEAQQKHNTIYELKKADVDKYQPALLKREYKIKTKSQSSVRTNNLHYYRVNCF